MVCLKDNMKACMILDTLIKEYGLREDIKLSSTRTASVKDITWYDMLNGKGLRKRIPYLRSIMRSGNKLDATPRIEVSTIHASKGGERDNVMLITDLSYGPYKSSTKHNKVKMMKQESFMSVQRELKKNYILFIEQKDNTNTNQYFFTKGTVHDLSKNIKRS